jgi:YegS/Rv2252/BmrU family lipid kinase
VLQDNAGWIAVGALLVVVVLAWLIASQGGRSSARQAQHRPRFGRRRPHRDEFRQDDAPRATPTRQAAIIVNPTKFDDVDAVQRRITRRCTQAGWAEPLFLHTTEKDTGHGQAKEALEKGVTIVCPLGGDGTVRAVASALVGTETPLGLLPGGTGNLLARNLDLPIDSIEDALGVALTGQNKRIDVGRLTVDASGEHEKPEEHVFLVMAGLGFDAAIMAGTPERLKATVGPAAYMVSGVRALRGESFRVRVKIDDAEEFSRRTRTVVIGNCGRLLGGLVLMPQALVDDGKLDTIIISPKGIVGWAAVAARLATKQRKGHERVDHHTSTEVRVRADKPQDVQLDGDVIGQARALNAVVDPLALIVRVGTPR